MDSPSTPPLTVRTIDPGGSYWSNQTRRIHRVPAGHAGLACQACPWSVHIPLRLGRRHVANVRRSHLETCHFEDLLTGKVAATEAYAEHHEPRAVPA